MGSGPTLVGNPHILLDRAAAVRRTVGTVEVRPTDPGTLRHNVWRCVLPVTGLPAHHGRWRIPESGVVRTTGIPLLLVDGHNLLFRAWFGTPAEIYSRDISRRDITTQFMFFGLLRKAVTAELDAWPEILVVFDGEHGSAGRQARDAVYKANRDTSDAARRPLEALADIKTGLDLFGIAWIELDDVEADDVIATLTTATRTERDVLILSIDQDFYQLLADAEGTQRSVRVLNTARRPGSRVIDSADVLARYGVLPAQFADLRALSGDRSDNIPGVRGVGPKTAAALLTGGLTLENLPTSGRLAGARGAAIQAAWPQVLTWREMIRLRSDISLPHMPTGIATIPLPIPGEVITKLGLWGTAAPVLAEGAGRGGAGDVSPADRAIAMTCGG